MATFGLPTFKAVAFTAGAAGIAYQGYRYSNGTSIFRDAHAESLPSDAKAALKKMEWKGFTELKLVSAEVCNHNVKRLTFALPDNEMISGIAPVTSMLTQHTPEGAWIPVFRPYTPISHSDQKGKISFMVKRYPEGKGSGKMHSLVPGDTMKFKTLQEFEYNPNKHAQIIMIAGGSGITPIYQLTQAILQNPADSTKLSLIYANNTPEDILLRQEFEDLEKQFPGRFQKLYLVSKGGVNDGLQQGYVTREMVTKASPSKADKVLVSGPPAMTEAIAGAKAGFGWTQGSIGGILKELGYTKEQVHKF